MYLSSCSRLQSCSQRPTTEAKLCDNRSNFKSSLLHEDRKVDYDVLRGISSVWFSVLTVPRVSLSVSPLSCLDRDVFADGYSVTAFLQAIEDQAKDVQSTDVGASSSGTAKPGDESDKSRPDREKKPDKMDES